MLRGSSPRPEFICDALTADLMNEVHLKLVCTDPEYRIHLLIVRDNPGDEGKGPQTSPYVVGEPEQDKREDCEIAEEAISAECPAVDRAVFLSLVEGPE